MSRAPQLKFNDPKFKGELHFGGALMTKAKNRHQRPLSSKDPIHLVLRSSKAKGRFSFKNPRNVHNVNRIVRETCAKYGVKLIEYSNNFNHLHLLVKFPSRAVYMRFIRSITGHLALAVSGASKMKSLKEIFGSRFWDFRPFTRVVRSWRGYRIARDYVILNQLEALEIIPYQQNRLRRRIAPKSRRMLD